MFLFYRFRIVLSTVHKEGFYEIDFIRITHNPIDQYYIIHKVSTTWLQVEYCNTNGELHFVFCSEDNLQTNPGNASQFSRNTVDNQLI